MLRYFQHILFIISILIGTSTGVYADTIRQMQYNLLYYTAPENAPDGCTQETNNLDRKDAALKLIMKEVMPDVLCVNEIGRQDIYAQRLLDNVLNTDGVNYYAFLPANGYSGSRTIGNRVFYDTRKFALKERADVSTYSGGTVINLYKMYYRSAALEQGDTTFITFIVWHLAAGGDDTRYEQSLVLTNFMNGRPSVIANNFVLSGDFNVSASTDAAYSNLLENANTLVRFYDPISAPGRWHNNPDFAHLFTQSTHAGMQPDPYCAPGGGMDDRFDFILVSHSIFHGYKKIQSLPATYHALGQDGRRWNEAIQNPTNTAVAAPIAQALYNASDHLPVIMDYVIDETLAVGTQPAQLPISITNPATQTLDLRCSLLSDQNLNIAIFSIDGKLLRQETRHANSGANHITIDFPFQPAVYLIKIATDNGRSCVKKIVKIAQ